MKEEIKEIRVDEFFANGSYGLEMFLNDEFGDRIDDIISIICLNANNYKIIYYDSKDTKRQD